MILTDISLSGFGQAWIYCFITTAMFNVLLHLLFEDEIYEGVQEKEAIQLSSYITSMVLCLVLAPFMFIIMIMVTFRLIFFFEDEIRELNRMKLKTDEELRN